MNEGEATRTELPPPAPKELPPPAPKELPPPAPWMFAVLVLPGAMVLNGFVSTVLASLLRREQVSLGDIANIIAAISLPSTLYFLWSPLVDFWIRRRTWIAVAGCGSAVLLAGALQLPRLSGAAAQMLLFVAVMASMLASAAVGGLMTAVVPEGLRTRVAGFNQMGNCGLAALGGGAMLYLSGHMVRRPFGAVCGVLVALPGLLALTVAEPPVLVGGDTIGAVLRRIGGEFKHTFWKWEALPVLLMLMAPFGSGAAIGLLPGLAPDYGISVDQVAWMNGLGGGLLTALGALLVGFVPMPKDMRPAYAGLGLLNAATLSILLVGQPRPVTYFAGATLYLITVGACYALFTALVLKLLGVSGKSGGSRYAIAVSLGNLPVVYMVAVDGLGARWFGPKGLPGIDMAVSSAGALVALGWVWLERRRGVRVELGLSAEEV